MRILNLRFKNLNSLVGEWEVDFTHPEYTSNGIFALTGPTGSGKTTLLDAISLALYGNTPRLNRVNKSVNEIMSLSTGECYASVVFETIEGQYLCHWAQHRARKSPMGSLQDCKHEISDYESGKILESKLSKVVDVVIQKTGMDFDRFTRSMLLAQGGFDSFLRAETEEKSRLLEQITGSKIYTEISKEVHEREKKEREKLQFLKEGIRGIQLLEEERIDELNKQLLQKIEEEKQFQQIIEKNHEALRWLEQIAELEKGINCNLEEARELKVRQQDFSPHEIRLDKAIKAQTLDADYKLLSNYRKQHVDLQKIILEQKTILPSLEENLRNQTSRLAVQKEKLSEQKKREKSRYLFSEK